MRLYLKNYKMVWKIEKIQELQDKINKLQKQKPRKKYKTICPFCNKEFITEEKTANEGVCYECRCF